MNKLLRYELRSQWKRFLSMGIMISLALLCYIVIDAAIIFANNRVAEEAKPIAGADIVVDGNRDGDEAFLGLLTELVGEAGIISKRISLNTNITTPTDSRLVQLLAVENSYPLYGNLVIENTTETPFRFGEGIAVDQQTYATLENNTITIGTQDFQVQGIIQDNPGLTLNLFTQGRQVIMPLTEIKKTGLLDLGARADYEYLIKVFDPNSIPTLVDTLRANPIIDEQRDVDDYTNRIEQISTFLNELRVYLLLVIVSAFFLVAVTSMLSIDEYIFRRLKVLSILQILGANKAAIGFLYLAIFLVITLLSILVATAGSYAIAAYASSLPLLAGFMIPPISLIHGGLITLTLTFLACIIPLGKVFFRGPLEGLAESSINIPNRKERISSISLIVICLLVVLRILGETRVQTFMLAGILGGVIAIIRGFTSGLLRIGQKISSRFHKNFLLFDAIRSTVRPGNTSHLFVGSMIIALSVILLITQFGGSFVQGLRFSNNSQPNRFIINLQKDDIEKIQDAGLSQTSFNTILGRIVSINNVPLGTYLENRGRGSVSRDNGRFTREFNITTAPLPAEQTIRGSATVLPGNVSVDSDFAKDLGLRMGDVLVFSIAGREFTVTVSGLRETDRSSFTPFFFFQLSEEQFADAPMTYFTTLRIPTEQQAETRVLLGNMLRPGVALIEIDRILTSIRQISERISQVVYGILYVILIFALFTTIVCIENMRYAKAQKMKLYYTLGVSPSDARKNILFEYRYLVLLAIVISCIIGRGGSLYFISSSPFITWSWISTLQGAGILLLVIVINAIVLRVTIKRN